MKIALIHYRVGETDGVSLEMDKWRNALIELGHDVIYISGNSSSSNVKVIKEIAYNDPYDLSLTDECYIELKDYNCQSLEEAIKKQAILVKEKFIKIINEEKLDCLIPNNIFALGKSLPITMGLFFAIEETKIKVVNHHHDFYWERVKYSKPTCSFISKTLKYYFPPKNELMKHVVINSYAQQDLLKKKNIYSTIVPNVFDFDAPLWGKDDYNHDLKSAYGLDENDIIFLQATRVTNRKGIELAIDFLAKLNFQKESLIGKTIYDGRIINEETNFTLLVVGLNEGIDNYEDKLIEYARKLKVKMIIDPTKIGHQRSIIDNSKIYSLWDVYAHADIITYPSIYEGWGNQFLEGLFAKKPMVIFEYSVFEADIKKNNFHYVSLGNNYDVKHNGLVSVPETILETAVIETIKYLTDRRLREKCVNENFLNGKSHYSKETLKSILKLLF